MGYGYFGGYGSDDPQHLIDHRWPNTYNDYYGYHWNERADWNGKAGGPTVSRKLFAALGKMPNYEPMDRPMVSDLAFNASNSNGAPYLLGINTQNRAAPINNHVTNNRYVPSYQGVLYMDGHHEGHQQPDTNLPYTGAWGIRMR
jgi:hypothetical protein